MEASKLIFIVVFSICYVSISAQTTSAALGDLCETDKECTVVGDVNQTTVWCYNKQCSCKRGYKREENNRCVIGGDCSTDKDCEHLPKSFCNVMMRDRAKCACNMSYVASEDNTRCVGQIGSDCRTQTDCIANTNVICKDNVCTCSQNMVPAEDNRRCYPASGHDLPCLEPRQCKYSDNTECTRGRCQCISRYQFNGTTCIGNLPLGDPCEQDIECTVEGDLSQKTVYCYNKQCSCKFGYTRDGNRCVIGGDCKVDKDCEYLENSFCNTVMRDRFKCACNNNFVPAVNSTKCLPAAQKLGEGCQDKTQCTQNLGKAECVRQRCECEKDARANDDNTKCDGKSSSVSTVVSISCLAVIILAKLL